MTEFNLEAGKEQAKDLYDYLFPPLEQIVTGKARLDENAIIQRTVYHYGKQGSGKSTFFDRLAKEAINRYGEDKVSVVTAQHNLEALLAYGFQDSKPIQILIAEDMTLDKTNKNALRAFFEVRHLMRQKTGLNEGLVVNMFSAHRLYGVLPELRENVNVLILSSTPNPITAIWDTSIIKKIIGEEGLNTLQKVEDMSGIDKSMKGYKYVYIGNSRKYWAYFDKPERKYATNLQDIIPPPKGSSYMNEATIYGLFMIISSIVVIFALLWITMTDVHEMGRTVRGLIAYLGSSMFINQIRDIV